LVWSETNYTIGYFVLGNKKMIFIDESLTRQLELE